MVEFLKIRAEIHIQHFLLIATKIFYSIVHLYSENYENYIAYANHCEYYRN